MIFQSKRRIIDGYTSAPTLGSWNISDLAWNSNPVPSGNLGWVCTTAGTACATAWASSTAYSVGQTVYYGTQVYLCTTAGTSAVAPTSQSTTVNDGTVVWSYVNPLAVFKTFGTIGA